MQPRENIGDVLNNVGIQTQSADNKRSSRKWLKGWLGVSQKLRTNQERDRQAQEMKRLEASLADVLWAGRLPLHEAKSVYYFRESLPSFLPLHLFKNLDLFLDSFYFHLYFYFCMKSLIIVTFTQSYTTYNNISLIIYVYIIRQSLFLYRHSEIVIV